MKRPFYGPTEDAQFRRRLNKGISYPLSRPADTQCVVSTDMTTSSSMIQDDQAREAQNRTDSQPPMRRRVQVACSRCRKRKIRCSGDIGNGQACTNCKNSGTSACLFVRVPPRSSYPQGTMNSVNVPLPEARRGNYDSHQYVGAISLPMNSASQLPSTSAPSPVSQADFDYGTALSSSVFHRSFGSVSPTEYDDNPVAYGMQAPSYMLPNGDASAVSGFCGVPGNLRGWPSSSLPLKPSNAPIYGDAEPHNPLVPTPNYPIAPHTSSQPPTFTEAVSGFPVEATLAPDFTCPDRTLPIPATGGRNNSQLTSAPGTDHVANITVSSGQHRSCSRSYSISADGFLPGSDREIASKVTTYEGSPQATKEARPSTPHDMGFGYISITSNSPVSRVGVPNGFQSSDSDMERSKREDLLYPPNLCSSSAYMYSSDAKNGLHYGTQPTAALTSGHEYTQLIDPHSRPMILGSNAEDLRPMNTNGNPIPLYGERRSY